MHKTVKESGILYRYPKDFHYNKYNFITVKLNQVSYVEYAIMEEMIKHFKCILSQSINEMSMYASTGSPYFFQGNYRMMYFPHKFLRDQYQYGDEMKYTIPMRKRKKIPF
jgi:hypothetical protein